MTRSFVLSIALLTSLSAAFAKPKITDNTGVRTLATAVDRSILARGSVFEIKGEGLGPVEAIEGLPPYATDTGGVAVMLMGSPDASVVANAYVIRASNTRVLAILPSSTPAGDFLVHVEYNGESSGDFKVRVADANFGLITNVGVRNGIAQGRIMVEGGDPTAITLASPISPGMMIDLDATGLGPIETADNDYPGESNLYPEAALLIGDLRIRVDYLGRNPNSPGYDRIMVTLPAENLPSGCMVQARLQIGETTVSETFTLPILAPDQTACSHPLGISPEGLATLSAGGSIVRGTFTLDRGLGRTTSGTVVTEYSTDQSSGGFLRLTADEVAQMSVRGLESTAKYDENRCIVQDAVPGSDLGRWVDAGREIKVTSPAWTVAMPRGTGDANNLYVKTLESKLNGVTNQFVQTPHLLITPGLNTLSGEGGADVGPFSTTLDVSTAMTWTNMLAITEIDTSKDLVLTFSGAGPDDTISGSGYVMGPAPENPATTVRRSYICQAKGSEGKVTIPSYILKQMPRATAAQLTNSRLFYSSLSLASYNPEGVGGFRVPLTGGGISETIMFLFDYNNSKAPVPVK